MSAQGFQPELCAACGHPAGDHTSSRSPVAPSYGLCLIRACGCREFVPAEMPDDATEEAA